MVADQQGRIAIAGTLTESCVASPSGDEFIVATASGVAAFVDNSGNMCLSGSLLESQTTFAPNGDDWLVVNATGDTVSMIDGTSGNLSLRDILLEGVTFS
jgi:hypothetical protein